MSTEPNRTSPDPAAEARALVAQAVRRAAAESPATRWSAIIAEAPERLVSLRPPAPTGRDDEPKPRPPVGADTLVPPVLQSTVDKIFVLNLPQDVTKWALTAESLSRRGLLFERFPAVDGTLEPHITEWRAYTDEGLLTAQDRELGRRQIESPGGWGYLKTMERLLAVAQDQGWRRIAVFDDDVMLHQRFHVLLDRAWSELPPDWVLVYLGCTQTDWSGAEHYSDHLYHPRALANGSFAFVLDAAGYDTALREVRQFAKPFDTGALRAVDGEFPRRTFAVRPQLAAADVTASSLRRPRALEDAAARAGWDPRDFDHRAFSLAPAPPGRTLDSTGLVSVICVCRDAADTAGAALESLRTQTHGKLEILVLDNGSTDATAEIVERCRSRDSRIRHLSTPEPLPPVAAANELLGRASGEFIAFHGATEVSFPDRVADGVAGLGAHPGGMAIRGVFLPLGGPPPPVRSREMRDWAQRHRDGVAVPATISGLVRRRVLELCGGLLATDAAGVDEWVRRAGVVERRRASAPIHAPDLTAPGAVLWDAAPAGAPGEDWSRFHDEIAKSLRPAFVPLGGRHRIAEVLG